MNLTLNLIQAFTPTTGFAFAVPDSSAALLFQHGKFVQQLAPGRYRLWKGGHQVVQYDLRLQQAIIQGQDLLTSDQVSLKISTALMFRVADPLVSYRAVADPTAVVYLEVQLALRQLVASMTSEEFLKSKASHGTALQETLRPRAEALGLVIDRIEVRDVMLPAELKKAFMAALQQRQEANASLEKARAETAAIRTLANAAKLMRENPELLQLRYLQTLGDIGAGKCSTLVLGLTDAEKLIHTKL